MTNANNKYFSTTLKNKTRQNLKQNANKYTHKRKRNILLCKLTVSRSKLQVSVAISPTRMGSGTNMLKSFRHKTATEKERKLILIYFFCSAAAILPIILHLQWKQLKRRRRRYAIKSLLFFVRYSPFINSSEKMMQYEDNKYSAPKLCLLFLIILLFFVLLRLFSIEEPRPSPPRAPLPSITLSLIFVLFTLLLREDWSGLCLCNGICQLKEEESKRRSSGKITTSDNEFYGIIDSVNSPSLIPLPPAEVICQSIFDSLPSLCH